MASNLLIVESPAKAKTIEKYLGPDYRVLSSYGHIRDLPRSGMSIDIEGGTFEPIYEVSDDKKKTVSALKKAVKGVDHVWLASDEDREGEAIAWHLTQALGLDPATTKRIVFREITKPAIQAAIKEPRTVNMPVVYAQQARRVLDRIVGYEISPVLWRKIRTGLSAGRVQSVAVRLIVEREEAIEAHEATSAYKVTGVFALEKGLTLKAELPKKLAPLETAEQFLADCNGATFTVDSITKKPAQKKPAAPFTTSTLQQEAARKLSFSVKQTMVVAQKLYEQGLITYMRTDSVNLSKTALASAAQTIKAQYGEQYHQIRTFKTKSSDAQEAHEAIRPTDFGRTFHSGERNQARLYDLIWKRAIASQMANAQLERTTVSVAVSTRPETLNAKGEIVVFDGFLKVYLESRDDEEDGESSTAGLLPPLTEGQELNLRTLEARETFTRPPARFTEATLVRTLEEKGIGRPSTYAPTISTIQNRGYVEKTDRPGREREYTVVKLADGAVTSQRLTEMTGAERSKLFPTDIGKVVNNFLVQQFSAVVDYDFTRKVEEEFDAIARGDTTWNAMLQTFYSPFKGEVTAAMEVDRAEVMQMRQVGTDPASGRPIFVRIGRYGPMVQMGEATDEEKPRFASLLPGMRMDDVTLEQALKLFELPRVVGQTPDGVDVRANFGRFGPYVQIHGQFVSLKEKEGDSPYTVTMKRAQELYDQKFLKIFAEDEIFILNGRWGPYIKAGKKNVKIPKDQNYEELSLADIKALVEAAPERKGRGRGTTKKKTTAKKKTTTKKKTVAKKKTAAKKKG